MWKPGSLAAWFAPPALVVASMAAIGSGRLPTGVPGEWTWNAPASGMTTLQWIPAIITIVCVVVLGILADFAADRRALRKFFIAALFPMAAAFQIGWHLAAPSGYGLAKWPIATFNAGSSGYYSLARDQIGDLGTFLENYPAWIREQDVLHTGTHPPGLFVEARLIIDYWSARPAVASGFMARMPAELRDSARLARPGGVSPVEQASVITIALVRWLAASLTVWPIYVMMRRLGRSYRTGLRAALLWCVVPSAVMFMPASDLLFPVLTASAVALAIVPANGASWRNRWLEPLVCGVLLACGMFFSLVFLAVGFIVAVVVMTGPGTVYAKTNYIRIGLIGAGFLAGTAAWAIAGHTNPTAIWLENQAKHAGFYASYPRSYLPWLLADFVEMAIGIGLPVFATIGSTFVAIAWRRSGWAGLRVAIPTAAVLVMLAVSGRSLSEVGRLWLPFFPLLLTAAVVDDDSSGLSTGRAAWLWCLLWCGIQIIWLQTLVQCVYPV